MYNFNGTAVLYELLAGTLILLGLLVLSFHDTVRDARRLYDPAVIQNFFRSLLQYRPWKSARSLLKFAAWVSAGLYFMADWLLADGMDNYGLLIVAFCYIFLLAAPLVYYLISDAFGPNPRKIWRGYVQRDVILNPDAAKMIPAGQSCSGKTKASALESKWTNQG